MNTLALLALAALAFGGSSSSSSAPAATNIPPPPPPVDNTARDINTGFDIAGRLIKITADLLSSKSGPVSTTI